MSLNLPPVNDSRCVPPSRIIMPAVHDDPGCLSTGAVVLPHLVVENCILQPTVIDGGAPPPIPGPNWGAFAYGSPVCLGCLGVEVSGHPNVSGGFSPPSAAFQMHTELVGGNPAFEYTVNQSGFIDGSYTGPDAHIRLTIAGTSSGGAIAVDNTVIFERNGVVIFQLSGSAMYVSGNYDFTLVGGVGISLRIDLQGKAIGSQSLDVSGVFSNIP